MSARGLSLPTDKLYFKIGEVAEIVGVAAHVLRFWETEFAALRPRKSRTQHRVYRRGDVATLLRIKHLLYVDRFTIAGARKQLRQAGDACPMAPPDAAYVARHSLAKVRQVVDELDALLHSAAEIDPAAADPAAYLRAVGGVGALTDDPAAVTRALVDRPPRRGDDRGDRR
ncbi:MAG: MerR family transcriptional regulator [Deltaproteobacteria bacterium]|nr:MerR family transcriptional regulator [Deltaproteobacteria bacterium]